MWGIIPAAGAGSRIQPLTFSKELLPVGSRTEEGVERPRAVSEYIVERMIAGGATKLCFVISPGKADILARYGAGVAGCDIAFVVQPNPAGLCDAMFRAAPFVSPDEPVMVGLPDTIWFPQDGLRELANDRFSFLLFPVGRPELFDAVDCDENGAVRKIHVKTQGAKSNWIWGAFKMPGPVFHQLYDLWRRPERGDEYFGTLVNAYLQEGGRAAGVKAGTAYFDVGTMHSYREAMRLLARESIDGAEMTMGARDEHEPVATDRREGRRGVAVTPHSRSRYGT